MPILPAQTVNDGNALTFNASYVYGQSIADLYTGLSGGLAFPALPPTSTGAAQTYPQDVDNGLVAFTPDGVLHALRWWSVIAGLQYYLPTPLRMWVTANYSHMKSPNMDVFADPANGYSASAVTSQRNALWNAADWFEGAYFIDATGSIRFGADYTYYHQKYLDGTTGTNQAVRFSAWYIF